MPTLLRFFLLAALAGCAAPGPRGDAALSQAQKGAVLRVARAVLDAGSCPGAAAEVVDAPARLEDPRHGGALRQPVRVEGCGRRSRLNMLVLPAPGGTVANVVQLLPGTTVADPLAQREGLRLALMAVRDSAPGCGRVSVNDTRPEGGAAAGALPGGGGPLRPWGEVWALSACGRTYAVPVRFAPGRDGTEITVDPGAVRPLA